MDNASALIARYSIWHHEYNRSKYLLRIPHSFNSKCINKGEEPEVKVIQKFDSQNVPRISSNLLREFRLYLADLDIKNKRATIKQEQNIRQYDNSNN